MAESKPNEEIKQVGPVEKQDTDVERDQRWSMVVGGRDRTGRG